MAYFDYTLMEICDALRSASAQAVCVLLLHLAALVRAQQEYAFGLLFGDVERKDFLMWRFLVDVFGSPDLVPYYDLRARCGVPLVDYFY